jgi:hypothetical protein
MVILASAVALVVAGQCVLVRVGSNALEEIAPTILAQRGRAARVMKKNISAGAIALVSMLVTIVPVTIVGRLLPEEVGHAHVIVTLSNAVGAVIVGAFFPLSLTLAERASAAGGLWQHSLRVARGVAWSSACTTSLYAVGTLVIFGAGLRLGSLGAYHAAV